MTSSDDRPDLPPEQDSVRRLLADARHDEPVPPAVAARLDAALAELSADRRGRPQAAGEGAPGASSSTKRAPEERTRTAPVVDLAARRRRGIGTALAAAAAVVVAGVGIGQVLGQGGSEFGADAGSGSEAGGDAEGGTGAFKDGAGESGPESAPDDDLSTLDAPEEGAASAAVPEVSSSSLRRDLRAVLGTSRRTVPDPTAGTLPAPGPACGPADTSLVGSGRQVPVTLDGRPALALYRAPDGTRRQVDVYLCGTGVPAASVDLRTR